MSIYYVINLYIILSFIIFSNLYIGSIDYKFESNIFSFKKILIFDFCKICFMEINLNFVNKNFISIVIFYFSTLFV